MKIVEYKILEFDGEWFKNPSLPAEVKWEIKDGGQVLRDATRARFVAAVNDAIMEGWEPHGDMKLTHNGGYLVSMVRRS